LAALFSLRTINFKSTSDSLSSVISVVYIIFLTQLPISIPYLLSKWKLKLSYSEFKEKYGSAYNGLRTSKNSFILFNGFFCLRRLIFSVAVVFFKDYTILQTIFCLVSPTLMLAYLIKVKPF